MNDKKTSFPCSGFPALLPKNNKGKNGKIKEYVKFAIPRHSCIFKQFDAIRSLFEYMKPSMVENLVNISNIV